MKRLYKTTLSIIFCLAALNSGATMHFVQVANNTFTPPSLNVTVDDTIVWQWVAGTHTTTSTSVPAGALSWDEPMTSAAPIFMYIVTVAGNYSYHCSIHAGMIGTIVAATNGINNPTLAEALKITQTGEDLNVDYFQNHSGMSSIALYDLTGKISRNISNEYQPSGDYKLTFSTAGLGKGVYIIDVNVAGQRASRRVIID
jgi:plastocyanin